MTEKMKGASIGEKGEGRRERGRGAGDVPVDQGFMGLERKAHGLS